MAVTERVPENSSSFRTDAFVDGAFAPAASGRTLPTRQAGSRSQTCSVVSYLPFRPPASGVLSRSDTP